jgi:hypothetical protein
MKKAEKVSWQSINLLHTSFYNNQIIIPWINKTY